MNLNKLAREITLKEGGRINLSIAQVKEVMKLFLGKLKEMKLRDLIELVRRK